MIKVKVTCFWEDTVSFSRIVRQYAFGQQEWKNLKFVTDDSYDRLVILTRPNRDCQDYDSAKAITFLTEPPESSHLKPHATSCVLPVYLALPFWQDIGEKDRTKITSVGIPKRNLLSAVVSELYALEGHKKRLAVVSMLDKLIESGYSHWGKAYGMSVFSQLNAYRGEIKDKYKALWSYKYHFACENTFINNYFTEKIFDPLIAECLCFYDGCQNLELFIDDRAFVKVDIHTPVAAVEKIVQSMMDNEWRKRIKYIRIQKKRMLYHLNPLNIIWMVLNGKDVVKECTL